VEAWERVLVDGEALSADVHSSMSCTDCHGGDSASSDLEGAHTGLTVDPSEPPRSVCGSCHAPIQEAHEGSLHATLQGYDTVLYERSTPENHPALEEMQANHCNNCHASCGQCHVSQPVAVGGGLLEGHTFVATPPMSRTCTGCHGSRIRNEYSGRNEGVPGDVHLSQARMNCADCHMGEEMHGVGVEANHRYDGARAPLCETCHAEAVAPDSGIQQHAVHGNSVACQVCHSGSYKNCSNCHVELSEDGIAFYQTDDSWMDFRIGRNPAVTEERPWTYLLVRHVPISLTSFDFYGEYLLPNFDNRPTWVPTTPHNIQRITPQNQSCDACHGNAALFLTPDAVLLEELLANGPVIVEELPRP
jgi:thiosulfate/3-mercaptopyruvate sulfurtransferase